MGCCVSELSALHAADIEPQPGSGTLALRSSKTDQEGRGKVRYLGPPTVVAARRWCQTPGSLTLRTACGSPVCRRRGSVDGAGAVSICAIIRTRASAVDGITERVWTFAAHGGRAVAGRRQVAAAHRPPPRSTCAPWPPISGRWRAMGWAVAYGIL